MQNFVGRRRNAQRCTAIIKDPSKGSKMPDLAAALLPWLIRTKNNSCGGRTELVACAGGLRDRSGGE